MRKFSLLAAVAAVVLSGVSAWAQEVPAEAPAQPAVEVVAPEAAPAVGTEIFNPFASRGAALPAVLRFLQGQGVPLVYLGDTGGLKGYLAEDASGRNQVLYVSPDGEHMIAGLMFVAGGQQVTNRQITAMMGRFQEAARKAPGVDPATLDAVGSLPEIIPEDRPIIEYFREGGLVVSKIPGNDGGLDAYLVDRPAADGVARLQQVFYVAPNDQYAVAGVMLRRGGVNVTGLQIAKMQERYLAERSTQQAGGSVVAPGPNPPPVPSATFPEFVSPATQVAPALQSELPVEQPPATTSGLATPAPQASTPTSAPASLAGGLSLPPRAAAPGDSAVVIPMANIAISNSPVAAADAYLNTTITPEKWLSEVAEGSVSFSVGLPGLPELFMVADPQCPFCHRMWQTLKPLVENGKVQVRVILIAGLSGSDPHARSLLANENPAVAWLQGQGSVEGFPIDAAPGVGTKAWSDAGRYLSLNMDFIREFEINTTPFLAYVSPDNRLFTSRGIPNDPDAFLAALQ